MFKVWIGQPYPLGATYDGLGTNFSLFSEGAERVELCLFDAQGVESRVDLPIATGFVWHGYVPSITPGQPYGYRVHGPWNPSQGQRFNAAKLLLDPYAKAIEGQVTWDKSVFPYPPGQPEAGPDDTDSAGFVPRSIVSSPYFNWSDDRSPRHAPHRTIIYETHVKGLSKLHPDVPPELQGTYAGVAHPAVVRHLQQLGVTTLELLPVHQFIHSQDLMQRGLRNYWGYDSIGFLAPHNEYASSGQRGEQVAEFKGMVRALHTAGLEVILDVVYNHTAEGNHLGPMLSFRGIDNKAYYRLTDDRRYYMDYTGTGNTLNVRHPHTLQLIMDSLRYWVLEMHVDGFRFDLAAALARSLQEVDRLSPFFDLIHQDPVVSQVKLIAEPWDVGEGGYQVGNFPVNWSEWNGRYRDTVRDFWRRQPKTLADFGYRFTGSSDLYQSTGRAPYASINFVTAHDGFTLRDLVSHSTKHNDANQEHNRDGTDDNRSWNGGAEGASDDPLVNALRDRQQRNFLSTLLLSQGVPMLLGGDELGRTQRGNNNAYCQDNEISWYDWTHVDEPLLDFTRRLIAFRREHPVLQRRRWFQGRPIHGEGAGDLAWFTPEGTPMSDHDWEASLINAVEVFIGGDALINAEGEPAPDDSFLVLFSVRNGTSPFRLPPREVGARWEMLMNTAGLPGAFLEAPTRHRAGATIRVPGLSVLVLRRLHGR